MAYPTVILTEGGADDKFVGQLIEQNKLGGENFHIHKPNNKNEFGGVTNFWRQIQSIRIESAPFTLRNAKALVIIADNDNSPQGRFNEVRKQIEKANEGASQNDLFGVPVKHREPTQQSSTLPPVHILMIPWENEPGCLESLCIQSANSKTYSSQISCVEAFAKCVGADEWMDADGKNQNVARTAKFRVQSLLTSICADPYAPLKCAWNTDKSPGDIFLMDSPTHLKIVDFLRTFINPPA
jgi:hypothetical protein